MDPYFCYIRRADRAVAELRILTCNGETELDSQLARLSVDYPGARLEVFQGERMIATLEDGARRRFGETFDGVAQV